MKIINKSIDANLIKIVPMGDLHIGSAKCDYARIKQTIADVADEPNAYVVLLGDIINNSTKTSVGDVYSEPMSPMRQMEIAIDLFTPIKDKILAVVSGNHERRSYKGDGVDLMAFFAKCLDIEDRYDYIGALAFIQYGKCPKNSNPNVVSLYVTHGDGQGGKLTGSKANGLEKRGNIIDADIIVTGHTHAPITFKTARYNVDKIHRKAVLKETTYVNIGATLEYEGYAEQVGLAPSSTAQPIINLTNEGVKVLI